MEVQAEHLLPARRWADRLKFAGPILAVGVLAMALFVLHRMAQEIHIHEIKAAILNTPLWHILLAIAFTGVSFMALAAYDVLAVRSSVDGPVDLKTAAFAGAAGYAVSNALGFPIMTGGSVRYRLYSAAGLNVADISRVVTIAWATFWLGTGLVVGIVLAIDPGGVARVTGLGRGICLAIALALLAVIGGFVAWVSTGDRTLNLFSFSIAMPDRRTVLAQLAAGAIDFVTAGATLYVLLPHAVAPNIASFAVVYAAALTAGIIAHTPGGLGVFEATLITGLGLAGTPQVLGSLILYRVIYYVLPLLLAALSLAGVEIARRRAHIAAASQSVTRVVQAFVPPLAGGLVFLGGVVLLISITLPHSGFRLDFLADVVPQPFVEASHLAASVVGVLLLVIARGLIARLAPAWNAAVVLLAAGAVFSLVKGLDWEEAIILGAFTAFLVIFRDAFYRAGRVQDLRPSFRWLILMASFIAVTMWLGFFFYRHVEYSNELWWDFAWEGNASRFLRALVFIGMVAAIITVDAVINRPRRARHQAGTEVPDEIRALVAASPKPHAALALLGDKRFLTADGGKAFLMYGVSGRSWIAMGDAIGDGAQAADLTWRFRELADQRAGRVVFYAVGADHLPLYIDMGLSLHKIGEVARVDLAGFSLEGSSRQELRYVDRRATKEGLSFEVLPKAAVAAAVGDLTRVSDAWLDTRNAKEKGFSLGAFSPGYVAEFDCAVMKKDGRIVAFANLWRGAQKAELAIDLMRYEPGASKILMDALLVRILLYAKAEGYRWFNLGAAPLSGMPTHRLAPAWNRLGALIFRHGEKFYPFEGLRAFKEKFSPVWQPQYIACRGGTLALPQILVDVAALIAGGRLEIIRK
ncbi:bifunctional lysylphosphatidylglycerol flippase/synthetase MprF [Oleomonas cavernae]|uniref:Bifunctional lysylphosphatidylglycerol flippase/synthetase MprF n=1 Tax=Oleomonas cavernae TaxID=2320859 RepID=A0A418WBV7_9PROT|nr:bifunctional lysylphosphatidylglycerol flippase/synthetase MprF [Oleomonas cavernae]RJF87523.1 bifunctional lysylphosphatidylglycerol flippase/synthetase MprF [Oleomonas cavernae]